MSRNICLGDLQTILSRIIRWNVSRHCVVTSERPIQYKPNGVLVESYSAKDLAQTSIFLDGEAAFVFLIELRENPEKALKQIAKRFKMK